MEPGDLYQQPTKYTTPKGRVRWKYRLYLGPHKRPFYKGFRTKAGAERDYQKRAREARRGVVVDGSAGRKPLSHWQEEWERTNDLSAATQATGISAWRVWIEPQLGATPIRTLTAQTVQTWIDDMSADGAGVPVQKQALAQLRRLIKIALACEAIASDPTRGVRVGSGPGSRGVVQELRLTPANVRTLIAESPAWCRLLIEVLAMTGMRQGEVFGLSVGDLDLHRVPPQLWVHLSWSPHNGGHLKATKTNKDRVVVVPVDTAARLIEHTSDKDAASPVFTTPAGARIDASNFRARVWLPLLNRARAVDPTFPREHVKVHELRHFYATTALTKGVDLVTVSKQLGHSSTSVTADIYARWVPTAGAAAANAVANAITGAGSVGGRGHLRAVAGGGGDEASAGCRDDGDDESTASSGGGVAG
ncbi:site-specific integrase [Corynebacterium sp. HMSC05E07]|uniref:tyrosine-type recombinase/integrase n=1 Tax=Corynebacterium sp. HMSC05E07 TaxID=1581117 RepID=UPI0008A49488|nr:site-specific integrase [Corynebacterium sp. HMSC05E07]OFT59858.1 hypothetical protein HMPREF3149_09230 [Corynebacterium sp. HMSC05E07]